MKRSTVFMLLALSLSALLAAPPQQVTKTLSVQGLIYDLKHPDADRREESAKILGDKEVRAAVPALVEASDDPETKVRAAVLYALDRMRDHRALPVYIKLSADKDEGIRRTAINAMVRLYVLDEGGFVAGSKKVLSFLNPFDSNYNDLIVEPYVPVSPDAIQALIARLNDPSNGVRKGAVMSLGILRGRAAVGAMGEMLPNEPKNDIRIEYFRSFYKIGDPSACGALIPHVNDPDKGVHDEAILVAGLLRCTDAVEPLMDIFESGIRERDKILKVVPASRPEDLQIKCLQALALIGDGRAEKLFVAALNHKITGMQMAGAEGLARIANPAHRDTLEAARERSEERRNQLALDFALYRVGRPGALEEMVSELGSIRYSDQVFDYLAGFSPEECPRLFPLLRSSKGKVRVKLIDALGLAGGKDTLTELESYTHDSDAEVANAAINAIRRLRAKLGE